MIATSDYRQKILDLYINPSCLSFFRIFFRARENFSDVIFATFVKFAL